MPTTYTDKAPGVYVEELSSGSAPIAGVGTSIAGFIGVESNSAPKSNEPNLVALELDDEPSSNRKTFNFDIEPPLGEDITAYSFFQKSSEEDAEPEALDVDGELKITGQKGEVKFATAPRSGSQLLARYNPAGTSNSEISTGKNNDNTADDQLSKLASLGEIKLCTNFTEFKDAFSGDVSKVTATPHSYLAHAVYGFFRNGGTRCYVVRVENPTKIQGVLDDQFAAIDEIALVAAPGVIDKTAAEAIANHCKTMGDRFAILDGPATATDLTKLKPGTDSIPGNNQYAALYFPWLKVTKEGEPIPPSGHMAGIYARVDSQRGVHKAPANEPVLGAIGLAYNLSKAKQGPLNKDGINCIRSLNGNILVWGARTLGGDANGEFKYISTRRLFNYLCESIDEGLQWTVFEPNSPELWAAIRRNVNSFLTMVWRSGALFGATPEQAFYVKCDAETNPLEQRELGQVVTEIGVAIVKPAEFVVFRLSQWSGGEG